MTLQEARDELEKFVKLKTTMRPTFVDVLLEATAEKRGRWIVDTAFGNDVMSDEQMVICSVCGKGIFWGKQNYCPNCGAKMDEVKDE